MKRHILALTLCCLWLCAGCSQHAETSLIKAADGALSDACLTDYLHQLEPTDAQPVFGEISDVPPDAGEPEQTKEPIDNRNDIFLPHEVTVNHSDYALLPDDEQALLWLMEERYRYRKTAFYVLDLKSQMSFGYAADQYFSPACTRKAGFALAWYKKLEENRLSDESGVPLAPGETRLRLTDTYFYDGTDYMPGAGTLIRKGYHTYTIRELLHYLLYNSDNAAYKALWGLLGSGDYVALAEELGIPLEERQEFWTYMRPLDLGLIWQEIWAYKETGSPESQLFWQELTNNLYCEISESVQGADAIAHKSGSDEYGYHDAGIVVRGDNAYVVVAMSTVPLSQVYGHQECINQVFERVDLVMQDYYATRK
ncbi:MAG: serine hydrolase [Clostridiales bacterium]|nr:serine hydrolase [Clostridiales bacterium]